MSGTDPVKSFETLDVQVKALEGDVRDIKTGMASLGAEIRQALASVSSQFTQQMSAVTSQVAQQQRTPWGSIGSIGAVLMTVIGFMVFQTITPLQADIKILKEEIVPRVEHNYRQESANRLFDDISKRLEQTQNRKYDDMTKTIDRLESENRELRHK
jgi:hypothetical protein